MALKRTITGLIWAAIFAVAVQLAPGSALAHGGHAQVAVAQAAPASTGHTAHATAAAKTNAPTQAIMSAAQDGVPAPTTPDNCTGGCCSNGTSCCGALLLVDAPSALHGVSLPQRAFLHTAPPLGLAPDELIRPPRILA